MKRTINILGIAAVIAVLLAFRLTAEEPAGADPVAADPAAGAGDTNSAATAGETNLTARSFDVVQRRNIFNPNRRAIRVRDNNTPRVVVEYFKLNGTMTYDDKAYAFFDGTGGQFRNKTLGRAEKIGGYTVSEITSSAVKLAASSNEVVNLRVGMQMRRENNGPWKVVAGSEPAPDATASDSSDSQPGDTSSYSSSGAADDIVKRLMERRDKENKDSSIGNDK